MTLTVNGETVSFPDTLQTVQDLLESRSLQNAFVAVEVNRVLIPKKDHATHTLNPGDTLEIVTLVGGG